MGELIPREVLFGNPEKVTPRISPDGTRMAYIAPVDGVLNVWVGSVEAADYKPVTRDTERGIRMYFWAHDNRHLLYIQDQGGDENWHLHSVDLESGEVVDLTPFEGTQVANVDLEKAMPNEALVWMNKDNPQLHDVYHLDLTTGELEKVVENFGVAGWVSDAQMQVRGAVRPRMDGGMDVLVRENAEAEWRDLISFEFGDEQTSGPIDFTRDGRAMYMLSSRGANAGRLVKMDIASGAIEVIAEDPKYDVTGALVHPDTREVQMVMYLKDRLERVVLDPSIRDDIEALERVHDGDLLLQGRDHADRVWLAAYTTDNGPVPYYAWDREAKKATFLFEHQPALSKYTLANMEPFAYSARDGLEIRGYLTFPPGVERASLPTVLNVHGGPWTRDFWGFNPEAQWLANRGYLCVQVNFRGSSGYGKDFLNAGDKQWGAAMHDDLVDAVSWVVEQGFTDPKRVAIYGGSYGGYAALAGATFTPEVFACAVSMCGPSSIKTLIENIPPYWMPIVNQFKRRVGDPDSEEDFLWSRSPLSKVDQIKIPVMVVQGANDPRVKQLESEAIVDAMKAKGLDHSYLLFADEGHGLAKPENRLKFYAEMEAFLAKHLGGRAEP